VGSDANYLTMCLKDSLLGPDSGWVEVCGLVLVPARNKVNVTFATQVKLMTQDVVDLLSLSRQRV
jgi:hypothetical protein